MGPGKKEDEKRKRKGQGDRWHWWNNGQWEAQGKRQKNNAGVGDRGMDRDQQKDWKMNRGLQDNGAVRGKGRQQRRANEHLQG